jgi:hypothetical protein
LKKLKRYKSIIPNNEIDYLSPILEKTFDIDEDVNLIYNLFFKEFIDKFKQNKIRLSDLILYDKKKVSSSILKTKDAKKAHNIQPCIITNDIFKQSTHNSITNIINISFSKDVVIIFLKYNYDINLLRKNLSPSNFKTVMQEITEHRLKSAIYHELTHWISNILHNSHLTNLTNLIKKYNNPELKKLGQKEVYLTYFEIDAQIHGIKNLKNIFKSEWDNLTFTDIFFYYPSLRNIAQDVWYNYGKEVLDIWQKNLLKRMSRENLIGKNMKGFVDIEKLTEDIYNF